MKVLTAFILPSIRTMGSLDHGYDEEARAGEIMFDITKINLHVLNHVGISGFVYQEFENSQKAGGLNL